LPALIALSITTLACIALFVYPQPVYELATAVMENSRINYAD